MSRLAIFFVMFSLSAYAEKLPIEAFGALPAVSGVKISPNGKKIAYKATTEGYVFIASVNLKTKEKNTLFIRIIKSSN